MANNISTDSSAERPRITAATQDQALAPEAVAGALTPAVLGRLLGRLRWFPAKGRAVTSVAFGGLEPLAQGAGERAALAWVTLEFAGGSSRAYQLPLAVAVAPAEEPALVLAEAHVGQDRGVLFDAVHSASFRAAIGQAFVEEQAIGPWRFELVGPAEADVIAALETGVSRVSGAEQSNTSLIFGEAAILKLYRQLVPGPNPDVEIAAFLTTRTGFRGTPALCGVLRVDTDEGTCVAGMLQRFAAGAADGWEHTLAQLRAWLPGTAAAEDDPFLAELATLGRTTGELHQALLSDTADPEFTPEPVTTAHIGRWLAATQKSVDAGLDRLLEQSQAPGGLEALGAGIGQSAAELLRDRAVVGQRVHELGVSLANAGTELGAVARHHGDFHLGQVLRTPAGEWLIIDFEGEPARPLAERRAKNHPLRDVAGMLRSFSYAMATVLSEHGGPGNQELAARAAAWERAARARFLGAYEAARGVTAHAGVLALFEVEKLFYELRYELENRPDWTWIPLGGALAFLQR